MKDHIGGRLTNPPPHTPHPLPPVTNCGRSDVICKQPYTPYSLKQKYDMNLVFWSQLIIENVVIILSRLSSPIEAAEKWQ